MLWGKQSTARHEIAHDSGSAVVCSAHSTVYWYAYSSQTAGTPFALPSFQLPANATEANSPSVPWSLRGVLPAARLFPLSSLGPRNGGFAESFESFLPVASGARGVPQISPSLQLEGTTSNYHQPSCRSAVVGSFSSRPPFRGRSKKSAADGSEGRPRRITVARNFTAHKKGQQTASLTQASPVCRYCCG